MSGYSNYIEGPVLEIGGRDYTERYGGVTAQESFILNYVPMAGYNVLVGDLCDHRSLEGLQFQTFIYANN